jgi:hypothetical protein
MTKYTSLLLIAALGLSSVVYAQAKPGCEQINYSPYSDFQKMWPTMIAQTTPDGKAFCAQPDSKGLQGGAFSTRGADGTLIKAADIESLNLFLKSSLLLIMVMLVRFRALSLSHYSLIKYLYSAKRIPPLILLPKMVTFVFLDLV